MAVEAGRSQQGEMMKVSELEGALLDAWVARALGKERVIVSDGRACQEAKIAFLPPGFVMHGALPEYSKDWAQGGPIIERERLAVYTKGDPDMVGNDWRASSLPNSRAVGYGPTPLIAAMRAFVAGQYGDSVPDN